MSKKKIIAILLFAAIAISGLSISILKASSSKHQEAKINYKADVKNDESQSKISDKLNSNTDSKSGNSEDIKILLKNLPEYKPYVQNDGAKSVVPVTAANITESSSPKAVTGQVLTITAGEKTTTYNADINSSTNNLILNSVAITKLPDKLTYSAGDTLDIVGLEVTGTYSDGTKSVIPITAANITGFDSSKAAAGQVLTITVGGKIVTYLININPKVQTFTGYITTEDDFVNPKIGGIDPSTDTKSMILMKTMARAGLGIAVKENNVWKFYYLDGKFATDNTSGADGTGSQLDAWNLVQSTTKADHISVTVTGELTEDTATNTGSDADGINYPVIKASSLKETSVLNSIAITKPAAKLIYSVGDKLDISGLEITGTYADNTTNVQSVKVGNITGFDSSKPVANEPLTITVGGKTTTYNVEIKADPSNIAITKPATKLIYNIKDKLDISGLEVTATYSDGSKSVIPITAANITGFDSSKVVAGKVLTITAGGKTVTYTVDVKPKVQTFTGYITTEDDFAANLGEDTAFMIDMKMMVLSGLGITFQQDGKWVFYYIDGNIATNNTNGAGGKWVFDGTGSQLNAWNIVEAQVKENNGANKMNPVPVTITGTLNGNTQTNPGLDADGEHFQVITVNSITKN
ncbi:bacterial Ig-like domain-containing protein [Clostridium pasteurianum]|uniref:Bacterial Ig-like domain (Group 3) n=1 Tax=Clostridium pasteurianum BC1 TaxID=86416 RepID=R4K6X0_CLOPA|nr:bacterial Ig-like domain-containing protein [Clostridium pasteurianum]AGK98927.1 Bacterial Ig-like domain (group 3) [Clostridium pasteurianum BC1]